MVDNNDFSPLNIPSLDNEVKMCSADELLDPLLCNSIVKILNYHTTVPYTFNMNQSQWSKVKNKYPFEHDLAIRFAWSLIYGSSMNQCWDDIHFTL